MTIFFTGDTHFGDPRALRFDHRPYPDLEAHDAGLIAAWNATVSPDDTVWHLGDFALGPSGDRIRAILAGLNGEKHLIVGNNDGPDTLTAPGWASVRHYAELAVEGRMVVLCHYAFRTWNGMSRGLSTSTATATASSSRCRSSTMSASIRWVRPPCNSR